MWNFENNTVSVNCGRNYEVYYSRFIASFVNVGGEIGYYGEFRAWLESLNLSENDIGNICEMANCGKMELEVSAGRFIERYRKDHPEG